MLDFSLHHGELLDWIALGIYGEGRPLLQISEDAIARGAYNTIEYNAIPYAGLKITYRVRRHTYPMIILNGS